MFSAGTGLDMFEVDKQKSLAAEVEYQWPSFWWIQRSAELATGMDVGSPLEWRETSFVSYR